jgi:hypothetical protein
MAFQEMNSWIYEETVEKLLKIKLVNQERAREVLNEQRQELDQSELSYLGADENAAFQQPLAPARTPSADLPPPQTLTYSSGPGRMDDDRQMNREQRRRMEKKTKKKKL